MKLMTRHCRKALVIGVLVGSFLAQPAPALERVFTYTYEPETMPEGAVELEQWVTLRHGRRDVKGGVNDRQNYNRWDLRTELEYGVTDIWQVALYLNAKQQSYRDATLTDNSKFEFSGISLENKVNIINPANHPVGVSLYFEPTFSGEEAELEQKIIIGQRHGDWKWALNLNHEIEWENNLHDVEGQFGASFGLTRFIGKRWAFGLEINNINKSPRYSYIESSAIYAGPVVTYRQEKWWATLTVAPQIFGRNWKDGADDRHRNLDLVHGERFNIRLLIGFDL